MRKLIILFVLLFIIGNVYAEKISVTGGSSLWVDQGDYVETAADNSVSVGSGTASSADLGTGANADVYITDDLEVDGDATIAGDLTVDAQVEGAVTIDVTDTEAFLVRKDSDGGDIFTVDTSTPKSYFTAGNVGIGTTAPGQVLSVYPDTDNSAIIGKAHIGYTTSADQANFAHLDNANATDYALKQGWEGDAQGIALVA